MSLLTGPQNISHEMKFTSLSGLQAGETEEGVEH